MREQLLDSIQPPTDDERLFLTAAEVGRQLGVRKSRVYALAASGLIPSVRLGPKKLLFPRRGLEQLAEAAIERVQDRQDRGPFRRVA